jgi:hypothetical protein
MDTPTSDGYRDRSTALVVFGIFEILIGGLFLLFATAMMVTLIVAAAMPERHARPGAVMVLAGLYVLLAGVCVTLGIGSIRARRWARALSACVSAVVLGIGVIATPLAAIALGRAAAALPADQAASAGGALAVARVVGVVSLALMLIVIPGVLFLFYRSPHVKRTCEARDPVERWTDRCPLPVLALSLYAAFLAASGLSSLGFHGYYPLFGLSLTGPAGSILVILTAGAWLWAARGLYRLEPAAWWLALGLLVFISVSSTLTLWHTDLPGLYAKMGVGDERAAEAAGRMGLASWTRWSGVVNLVPLLIWILAVRGRFRRGPPRAAPGATAEA